MERKEKNNLPPGGEREAALLQKIATLEKQLAHRQLIVPSGFSFPTNKILNHKLSEMKPR